MLLGSGYDFYKNRDYVYIRDSAKNGVFNSVKYGFKGKRHKNANMYVARK